MTSVMKRTLFFTQWVLAKPSLTSSVCYSK